MDGRDEEISSIGQSSILPAGQRREANSEYCAPFVFAFQASPVSSPIQEIGMVLDLLFFFRG
jgi:hypothetical protein